MMEENLSASADDIRDMMQARIVKDTTYFGVKAIKCPLDAWVSQEIT